MVARLAQAYTLSHLLVFAVDVGPILDEDLSDSRVSAKGGQMQRRIPLQMSRQGK